MTKEEFKNVMAAMHAAYPSEKITDDEKSVKMWWRYLEGAAYRDVTASLSKHIRTSQYPPTISELLNKANRKNRFNNFLPRNYDMDKLERALLLSGNESKRLEER